MTCEVCGGDTRLLREVNGYRINDCSSCRHASLVVEQRPTSTSSQYSDSYFKGNGGTGYVDYLAMRESLIARGRRYERLARRYIGKSGSMLDVGAAAGFTMKSFRDAGWSVDGVDANASMARAAQSLFDLRVNPGSLESIQLEGRYDCVLFLQVLEHLTSPESALQRIEHNLYPGAVVLVETWNLHSAPASILGRRWHQFNPPSVVHWFSPRSLTRMFKRAGYSLIDTGRPVKSTSIANGATLLEAKFPMIRRLGLFAVLSRVPGTVGVPYPPLDVFWAAYRYNR